MTPVIAAKANLHVEILECEEWTQRERDIHIVLKEADRLRDENRTLKKTGKVIFLLGAVLGAPLGGMIAGIFINWLIGR